MDKKLSQSIEENSMHKLEAMNHLEEAYMHLKKIPYAPETSVLKHLLDVLPKSTELLNKVDIKSIEETMYRSQHWVGLEKYIEKYKGTGGKRYIPFKKPSLFQRIFN